MARSAAPEPFKQVIAQRGEGNAFDVTAIGESGKLYHAWYDTTGNWHGWECLSDPSAQ